MSAQLPSRSVGVQDIPLDQDRSSPDDYKLIRASSARAISVLSVDAEAYFHFGSKEAVRVDAREFQSSTLRVLEEVGGPIGTIYLENPTATAGDTLTVLFSAEIELPPEVTVDSIQSITDPVDVSNDQTREIGKARVMDSSGVLVDPVDTADLSPLSDTTQSAGTDVTLTIGDLRSNVSVAVDTSGGATLTVEVSPDGGTTWYPYDTVAYSSAVTTAEEYTVPYADVRASVGSSLNRLSVAAGGL
jgi:hypothetical protein